MIDLTFLIVASTTAIVIAIYIAAVRIEAAIVDLRKDVTTFRSGGYFIAGGGSGGHPGGGGAGVDVGGTGGPGYSGGIGDQSPTVIRYKIPGKRKAKRRKP